MATNTINVTSDTVIKLLIRRGTDADRQNIILNSGEFGYAYDTKRVFIGDGVTLGGNIVGNINFGIVQGIENYTSPSVLPGDMIYQYITSSGQADNTLYTFNAGEWQSISPKYSLPGNPGTPGPLTNAQGYVNFNPTYFYLDTTNSIFNVYGDLNIKRGITSSTLKSTTMSTDMVTINNEPVHGTDGVNLIALLSGIDIAEAYARSYNGAYYVPLSGKATMYGTLSSTKNIVVPTPPANGNDVTNRTYVDSVASSSYDNAVAYTANRYLPLSGGTISHANNTPAVIINQTGGGPGVPGIALQINDTNYGANPFIVDNFGSVGVGGIPAPGGVTQLSIFGTTSAQGDTILNGSLSINKNNSATITLGRDVTPYGSFEITKDGSSNTFDISSNAAGSISKRFSIDQSGNVSAAINGGRINIGAIPTSTTNKVYVQRDISNSSTADIRTTDGTQWIDINSNQSVGSWNPLIQNNDASVIYSAGTIDNASSALVIGPWSASSKGLRIDNSGRIAINTSFTGATLTLNGSLSSNSTISTTGDINATGALRVTGNITTAGTISATGNITTTGTISAAGNITTAGNINAAGDITAFYTSDKRLKNNIKSITSALDKIEVINGVEYDWNTELQDNHAGHDVGVIAQEIEHVLPEAVTTRKDGYKAVNYDKVIPLLLQAIKELKAEVQLLKK